MTYFGDIASQALGYTLFTPQALTQTTTSSVVDMITAGGFGTTGLMTVGAVSGTGGPGLTVKFQECDTTNGTFSDITGAAFSQITTSGATTGVAPTLFTVFNRSKRYIQAVGTVVGTTNPSLTVSVVILTQKKQL
jgi:hypothetical protein